MSEERTEQPTGKKLRDAREKGQIARSKEVHDAFQLAAVLIALTWFGRVMVEGLSRQVVTGLEAMGRMARRTVTAGDFTGLAMEMGLTLIVLVGPIAFASIVGGIGSVAAQGGWNLSWEPLQFNLSKLSPDERHQAARAVEGGARPGAHAADLHRAGVGRLRPRAADAAAEHHAGPRDGGAGGRADVAVGGPVPAPRADRLRDHRGRGLLPAAAGATRRACG